MTRAHLVRPVLDEEGRPVTNINVRVLDPTTNDPVAQAIYPGPLGPEVFQSQPINFLNGIIDFYLDLPRRVRIGVQKGTAAEIFFEDVDVLVADIEGVRGNDVELDANGELPEGTLAEVLTFIYTAVTDHVTDTEDAHDASAVSFDPPLNTTFNAATHTTVQAALAFLEASVAPLDPRITALEDEGFQTAAQTAFTPDAGLTATNVQDAITEVATASSGLGPKVGKGIAIEGSVVLTGWNGAPGYFASRDILFADSDYAYEDNDADAGIAWADTGGGLGGFVASERGLYTFMFTADVRNVGQGTKFTAYAGIHPNGGHINDLSGFSRSASPLIPKGDGTFEAKITFVNAGPWLLEPGESVRLQVYLDSPDNTANCGAPNIVYWLANALRVG